MSNDLNTEQNTLDKMNRDPYIDIICPLYNGEQYIESLHQSLLKQKNVNILSIHYILTKSDDKSEGILNKIKANYNVIDASKFSHSLTREKAAMNCQGEIVVFITQDVIIERNDWLYYLVKDIIAGNCEAAYSRQICKNNSIEKYTRENNYPSYSFYKSKEDISQLGLNTFFYSDASSAVRLDVFKSLNGYDNKDLPTNEDMYLAYKLIMNGYRIKYAAESVVIHSHNFNFKTLYKRYKDTGRFFKENPYLNKYGTNSSGAKLAIYILKRIIEDKNIKALFEYIPNMAARFIGMKVGSYE